MQCTQQMLPMYERRPCLSERAADRLTGNVAERLHRVKAGSQERAGRPSVYWTRRSGRRARRNRPCCAQNVHNHPCCRLRPVRRCPVGSMMLLSDGLWWEEWGRSCATLPRQPPSAFCLYGRTAAVTPCCCWSCCCCGVLPNPVCVCCCSGGKTRLFETWKQTARGHNFDECFWRGIPDEWFNVGHWFNEKYTTPYRH